MGVGGIGYDVRGPVGIGRWAGSASLCSSSLKSLFSLGELPPFLWDLLAAFSVTMSASSSDPESYSKLSMVRGRGSIALLCRSPLFPASSISLLCSS